MVASLVIFIVVFMLAYRLLGLVGRRPDTDSGRLTYSNLDEAADRYWREQIIPLAARLDGEARQHS